MNKPEFTDDELTQELIGIAGIVSAGLRKCPIKLPPIEDKIIKKNGKNWAEKVYDLAVKVSNEQNH